MVVGSSTAADSRLSQIATSPNSKGSGLAHGEGHKKCTPEGPCNPSLHKCIYVYIYIHTLIWSTIYVCVYMYTRVTTCVYTYVYTHVFTYIDASKRVVPQRCLLGVQLEAIDLTGRLVGFGSRLESYECLCLFHLVSQVV